MTMDPVRVAARAAGLAACLALALSQPGAAQPGPGNGPPANGPPRFPMTIEADARVQQKSYPFAPTGEEMKYTLFVSSKVRPDVPAPLIVALHGLNGSSDAHYMRGLAAKAFARGLNVVRLNQRNCGDTERLSVGLFHSGLTADAAHVVHELTDVDGLPAIAVAGYSLGGNLALKLAAEYGSDEVAVKG